MAQSSGGNEHNLSQVLSHLGKFIRLERKILTLVAAYAFVIGLFSLIVPLTVQELVNTFSFAIQPVMIVTLTGIMVVVLVFVGLFKTLQHYAVEVLQRRLFVRTAFDITQKLFHTRLQGFNPRVSNYFVETVFMQRALSVLLVDLVHVIAGGVVGMTILIFYHPYFILVNLVLLIGFMVIFFVLSRGGLRTTIAMSQAKYDVLRWIQEISENVLHMKATDSHTLLVQKTDQLTAKYIECRRARFAVLLRQFIASVGGQAVTHGGVLALAGSLLATDQLTIGQLVAVEVVVAGLISNFDAVVKSIGQVYYFFTALEELETVLALPKDQRQIPLSSTVTLPDPTTHGIWVRCKGVGMIYNGVPVIANFDLEVRPGESVAIYARTRTARMSLARLLAGLELPTSGSVSYNDIDLRDLNLSLLNQHRGFMIDSQLSLIEGTIADNIVWRRPSVSYDDVRWALRFTQLQEEVATFPEGINSNISALGETPTSSHILRILLARAIVGRPRLLVCDGLIHDVQPPLRDTILRRLCSKEEPWTVIFVSNDPDLTPYADRQLLLGDSTGTARSSPGLKLG
jgi:putative ABC transport system ATP-binding protein